MCLYQAEFPVTETTGPLSQNIIISQQLHYNSGLHNVEMCVFVLHIFPAVGFTLTCLPPQVMHPCVCCVIVGQ